MADEPKHRTPPPAEIPADESFTPGRNPDHEPHPPEDEFWDNVMFESNEYKMEHYRAAAQQMANDLGCAVLLHYYKLPAFQRNNPTMLAALIPADEGFVTAPDPAPPPETTEDQSWRRKSSE